MVPVGPGNHEVKAHLVQRDEVQSHRQGGRSKRDRCVGAAARHGSRRRHVASHDAGVTGDLLPADARPFQQVVEQRPAAGADLAIHHPDVGPRQISDGSQALGVPGRDDQALFPAGKFDDQAARLGERAPGVEEVKGGAVRIPEVSTGEMGLPRRHGVKRGLARGRKPEQPRVRALRGEVGAKDAQAGIAAKQDGGGFEAAGRGQVLRVLPGSPRREQNVRADKTLLDLAAARQRVADPATSHVRYREPARVGCRALRQRDLMVAWCLHEGEQLFDGAVQRPGERQRHRRVGDVLAALDGADRLPGQPRALGKLTLRESQR